MRTLRYILFLVLLLVAQPAMAIGLLAAFPKDSTDKSVPLLVLDSSTGVPEAAFAYDTTGIDLWYRREGGLVVSITEAELTAADDAHSDGGVFYLADGVIRLDLPDAALATGADYVDVGGSADGMVISGGRIVLSDPLPDVNVVTIEGSDATDQVRDSVVDDATRIDASALNTAAAAVGSDGSGLTEAAGDGDHLTAIDLPNQSFDLTGNITGNVSGSVGSVTSDVGVNEWNGVALGTTNPLPNADPDAAGGLIISDAGGLDADALASYAASTNNLVLTLWSQGGSHNGTIGDTGNDATHLHLVDQTAFGDDELNDRLLIIIDMSAGVQYSRWITDWDDGGNLATLHEALPFTPENGVDYYYLSPMRQDATIAGITGTITTLDALDTAQDTQHGTTQTDIGTAQADLTAIVADTNELQTDLADGGRLDLLIDAILADTALLETAHAEPTGVPAANATPLEKLAYIYAALRNKVEVTASKKSFFDDADSALWEKDLSDDGTTYQETEANAP